MALFGKKPRTAQQKAQWAKTRIMIRAAALIYIVVYILVPLINPSPEDVESINPVLRWAIVAAFAIATVAIGIQTTLEFIRNNKAGNYKAEAYTDDPELTEAYDAEASDNKGSENDDDEHDDDDDDEYDDDDDDEYDDDDDEYDDDDDEYDDDDDGEYDEENDENEKDNDGRIKDADN